MLSQRTAPTIHGRTLKVGDTLRHTYPQTAPFDVTAFDPQGNVLLKRRDCGREEMMTVLFIQHYCYFADQGEN